MTHPDTITICMGSSCFARGNRRHLARIEEFLKERGLLEAVTIQGSHCEAQCQDGPNLRIGEDLYQRVDEGLLFDILNTHFPGKDKE